jgi:hypothetical protein
MPSVYVPPLMAETKFHAHTEPQAKLYSYAFLFLKLFDCRQEERRFWTEWQQV